MAAIAPKAPYNTTKITIYGRIPLLGQNSVDATAEKYIRMPLLPHGKGLEGARLYTFPSKGGADNGASFSYTGGAS